MPRNKVDPSSLSVILPHPPWGPLSYLGDAPRGSVVYVPLQARLTVGVVWGEGEMRDGLKPILASTGAILPGWVMASMERLAHSTEHPPGYFLRFALPPGVEDLPRLQIRPRVLPVHVPGVRSRLLNALTDRRWRSWKRLKKMAGATSRDLFRLLEAGAVEVREIFPQLAETIRTTPSGGEAFPRGVMFGLTAQQKRRFLLSRFRKRPVLLWCADTSLAERWGHELGWPVYTSTTRLAHRRRIWREALEGRLRGVVVTHAGFLLPLPEPDVIVDEPWMEGFFFRESLTLSDVLPALATRVVVLRSAPEPDKGRRPEFTILRRLPERSPAWDVFRTPRPLWTRMGRALERGHNVAIWVERKGYGLLLCDACGWRARCLRDHVPLVLHRRPEPHLVCPRCGFTQAPPHRCPACGGETLRTRGRGMEFVAEEVKAQFPHARVITLAGTPGSSSSPHRLLHLWEKGGADVLVGTWAARAGFVHPAVRMLLVWYPETSLRTREEEQRLALRLSWLTWMGEGEKILLTFREDLPLFRALKEGTLRSYFRRTFRRAQDSV